MQVHMTPAVVRWAYRLLLGREPESQATIDNWCGAGSFQELREGILVSPEMAALSVAGFPETGDWVDEEVTEEAVFILLALRDGQPPDAEAVHAFHAQHQNLLGMRRALLLSPPINERMPLDAHSGSRRLSLPGGVALLRGDHRDPEFAAAPGLAPRHAALLRAAWPDGGEGRVLVESEAGIGVTTLGLAIGAPRHALLLAHEPSRRKAATLAENLADNGLAAARVRQFEMAGVAPMMEREGLDRLDLLRLAEPGALRLALENAPLLRAHGTLVIIGFDLTQLLLQPGPSPLSLLAECCATFAHVVAFGASNEPIALLDKVVMKVALRRTLMRPDRRDEFVLCANLDWIDRFRLF